MHVILCVLITAACAIADTNQNRRTKLPYIADAVGNSLPPPSSVPATVGSPVNLLTPDRYEFYTFDESGELVKRLMTLEEIQAIVAAGEETDGLVTFANDNQPTIAFNFTQPSQTKVHNVVTNVQNVLKAQMEAHKNRPNVQPTLDTPDVSDSWSLILPSIFGNTGVDIVPDKTSGSFITPETETFDMDNFNTVFESSQSKESNEIPTNPTTKVENKIDNISMKPTTEISSSIITYATTKRPFTTTNKQSLTTITSKPIITTTTNRPKLTTPSTTFRPSITTNRPKITSPSTTFRPSITTNRPKITSPSTTSTPSTTTVKLMTITTKKTFEGVTTQQSINDVNKNQHKNSIENSVISNFTSTLRPIEFEKKSTYTPTSTIANMTTKGSNKEQTHTVADEISSITMLNLLPSTKKGESEKNISTTITTQSISPSTIVSTTELMLSQKNKVQNDSLTNSQNDANNKEILTSLPLFDVAQSISQIASDLGNNYVPIPTSNSLVETKKISSMDVESKENIEIEIPTDNGDENDLKEKPNINGDNYVKISTFDPHSENENKNEGISGIKLLQTTSLSPTTTTELATTTTNVMDPILTGSMDDLISQVVHDNPDPTTIVFSDNNTKYEEIITVTEKELYLTKKPVTETTTSEALTSISSISLDINDHPLNQTNDEKTEVIKELKDIILYNRNEISKLSDNKNISEIKYSSDSSRHSNNSNDIKLEEEQKNNGSFEISNPNSLEDIIESSTFAYLSTENNMISSTLPDTTTQQNIKVNNKFHKLSEEFPKFDEFKKKIQKVNIDEKELATDRNNSWKLIPTVTPTKINEDGKDKHKMEVFYTPESNDVKDIILEFPKENQGLEVTTKDLGEDVMQFTELCNELAFKYWKSVTENVDKKRSIVFSPYSITSMLAMMFMGAKGATSGEMNEVLKLDDMVTFNPHFTLKNISDSIETTSASGVAVTAFIRELYSERNKGRILTFYKERAQHFYNGHVEEVNFKLISDIIRRRTNLLVKRYTWGKIVEYMKTNSIVMQPPLAAFSANIFYTDCTGSSVEGRDGEMYFVVSPNVRQRRLVPVPAVVYKTNFLAGYDPVLDATAAALGNTNSVVTILFLMPGQQGNVVHADDLENLEKRLLDSDQSTLAWNKLLRTLLPRNGLELQIPRFSQKSIFNASSTLRRMGLKELFDADHADLGGMNGPSKDLYLSDMIQLTTFATCGEGVIGEQHHIEDYPELININISHKPRASRWLTGWDEPLDYQRAFHDPHDVGEAMHLPLHLRPRQARLPARNTQPARLKFDRPFLFFVRHNPSGMILYIGRYNPRLLP